MVGAKIHRLGSDTDENHDQILDTKDESGLKTSPEKQDGAEQNKPIDKENRCCKKNYRQRQSRWVLKEPATDGLAWRYCHCFIGFSH